MLSAERSLRSGQKGSSGALAGGGAAPDNARRSGPVAVTLSAGDRHTRRDDRPGQLAERRHPVPYGGVWLRHGAGHRRGGQRPATVPYRARGSARLPCHLRRESPSPWPVRRGAPPLLHALRARPAHPSRDRPGPFGSARRRCALEAVRKVVTAVACHRGRFQGVSAAPR
jgi:hypothetical protein